MRKLEQNDYQALRDGAEVLEADAFGEKVLKLPDGRFLKLFRRKRLLSSAAWYPYAQRFADNAAALVRYGIPCPQVVAVYRISAIQRDAVLYDPLPGITLRHWNAQAHSDEEKCALRADLNRFILALHQAGIYFRSLHLGNVVLTPQGQLGLIDISDLRIYRRALGRLMRKRNLRRMWENPVEREWLEYDALIRGQFQ